MKKTLLLLLASAAAWAQGTAKFTAEIKNANSDSLAVYSESTYNVFKSANGRFTGTVDVDGYGFYRVDDGSEFALMFIKEGFDLKMTMDASQFDESITFTGKGAKENNLLAKRMLTTEKFQKGFEGITSEGPAIKSINDEFDKLTAALNDPDIDENFKSILEEQLAMDREELVNQVTSTIKLAGMKGKPSPKFTFENHKGGKTTLDSFKGKYVYIDVWATWCGPCRGEIPYLKKVEEKYHGKNIEFVSVSIDDAEDHQTWKDFVTNKQLGGTQLYAENAWENAFIQGYGVNSIPRFILIDPKGNVVDGDAKRPSDPELTAQLDKLLK